MIQFSHLEVRITHHPVEWDQDWDEVVILHVEWDEVEEDMVVMMDQSRSVEEWVAADVADMVVDQVAMEANQATTAATIVVHRLPIVIWEDIHRVEDTIKVHHRGNSSTQGSRLIPPQ